MQRTWWIRSDVAHLYRDRAHNLPPELFEILLDDVAGKLDAHLSSEDASKSASISRHFNLLAAAVSPAHLDLLQKRRGSKLETLLTEYLLRQGPQRGVWWTGHEREPGLEILRRINGDGITTVINDFLACDDRFGRFDALKWAMKRPDATSFRHAAEPPFPMNYGITFRWSRTVQWSC